MSETHGQRPSGLLMLDDDQRVAASDAGATTMFGPDPKAVLRAQIYSLVDDTTAKEISRAVRAARAVQYLGRGRSGAAFSWALTTVKKRQFVGVWSAEAPVAGAPQPSPYQESPDEGLVTDGLLDLNRRLSAVTTVSGAANVLLDWAAQQRRSRQGFLAVFDGEEFTVVAAWPEVGAVVRSLRFPLAVSQAGMFGLTLSPAEAATAEPYLVDGVSTWVVSAHYAGRLECLLGDSAGEHEAESLAQVVAPHLARIKG